jgi:transcription initiation factor TFIID TATA-box-binding protein
MSMSEEGTGSDPTETLAIQNVVASTRIEHELDLHTVAMDLDGAEYDPEQFPGLIYRPSDHPTVLLFRSGENHLYRCAKR